jgi:DNA polymerase III subunit delta'
MSTQHFAPYPWQMREWGTLRGLLDTDKMPHGVLIAGVAEIGKKQFCMALAARMLCQKPDLNRACFRCKACNLVVNGSHPDLFIVSPEESGKSLSVDAIRALNDFATKTPMYRGWRVAVIDPTDGLTHNAANALLKTLEEPGDKTLLLLIHHQTGELLPTIRSRCQRLFFPLPVESLAAEWLGEQCDAEDYGELLALAGRRPLRAARLSKDGLLTQLKATEQIFERVAHDQLSAVEAAENLKAIRTDDLIEWLQEYLFQSVASTAKNGKIPSKAYFLYDDQLNFAKKQLASKVNPNIQLLVEDLLLGWARLSSLVT